ncbi:MAG: heat-inducible transcription repressor HrcA [Dehalococcoidia bacterium]|nr:heat-inducible transcription repressor HrcA [Dehalococcoidia bacterium]
MVLTKRRATILGLVVREYVQTAEPVSSKALVDRRGLDVSSATVRNEMARLEDDGYITHPHTSAGRIPSDLGYRTYVQSLMAEEPVGVEEQRTITHQLHQVAGGLNEWLSLTATILAGAVGNVAVVTRPRAVTTGRLRHLQLVELNPDTALLIAVMDDGRLRQQLVPLRTPATQAQLHDRAARLNARLAAVDGPGARVFAGELADIDDTNIMRAADDLIEELRGLDETYLDGLSRALRQPEFADPDRMLDAVARLQAYRLRSLLEGAAETQPGETRVVIGSELAADEMQDWSVVIARYGDPDTAGTVAVVGPTRMAYERTIPRVRYIASLMGQLLHNMR